MRHGYYIELLLDYWLILPEFWEDAELGEWHFHWLCLSIGRRAERK